VKTVSTFAARLIFAIGLVAIAAPATAPIRNCPSAPMFQTLAR